jgi:TetR/AcrR family transcriptional regulator
MVATPAQRSSDRILQKALKLFSSRGYDATSVREICAAADVTKPTLYHFYGSKDGLYRTLVEGALERFRTGLVERLAQPGPAADKLRRVARLYFESARGQRELMRLLFGIVHNPPATAPPTDIHRFYEGVLGLVGLVIEDGVAGGELRPGPTDVRLLVLMGALGEALCGYLLLGRPDLTPELAHAIVDTILDGWSRVA